MVKLASAAVLTWAAYTLVLGFGFGITVEHFAKSILQAIYLTAIAIGLYRHERAASLAAVIFVLVDAFARFLYRKSSLIPFMLFVLVVPAAIQLCRERAPYGRTGMVTLVVAVLFVTLLFLPILL